MYLYRFKKFFQNFHTVIPVCFALFACTQAYQVEKAVVTAGTGGSSSSESSSGLQEWTQEMHVVPADRRIDILFVVDNSKSMENEQTHLAESFDRFISNFDYSHFDFRIGILSTDTRPVGNYPLGTLPWTFNAYSDFSNMGPGSLLAYRGNEKILTKNSPNLATQFLQNVTLGVNGSASEMGIQSLIYALSPELTGPGRWNADFLRPDAFLSMIILSDEDETLENDSQTYLSTSQWAKDDRFIQFDDIALPLKNNRKGLLRVDSIVLPADSSCASAVVTGTVLSEFASRYNGSTVNICDDFSTNLEKLGSDIAIQVENQFALEKVPVADMLVKLNGVLLSKNTEYIYNANNNTIELVGSALNIMKNGASDIWVNYKIAN